MWGNINVGFGRLQRGVLSTALYVSRKRKRKPNLEIQKESVK